MNSDFDFQIFEEINNAIYSVGQAMLGPENRVIYVLTTEPDDWRGGLEFDSQEELFKKEAKILRKNPEQELFIWKMYLDEEEYAPIAIFVLIRERGGFIRVT